MHALLSDVGYMRVWERELREAGATVHCRPLIPLRHRPLRFVGSILDRAQSGRIAEYCREVAPEGIVVNQQYDEDGLDYLTGARMTGVPYCGVMHMPMTREKNLRFLGRLRGALLRRWFRQNEYRLVFVSHGAQLEFEAYYPAPRPTFVINNSIPLTAARVPLPRPVWDDAVPVVGFIGQFVPQKNLFFLIDGWLRASASGHSSRLMLVGDGPQRIALERYLRDRAAPDSWYITGWTTTPKRYAANIDLFLLVSHFEGLSLSLLEFVAEGKPALIASVNGTSDVTRRAPWVRQTSNACVEVYARDLGIALEAMRVSDRPAAADLKSFQAHFSLPRMAQETLSVLGLET